MKKSLMGILFVALITATGYFYFADENTETSSFKLAELKRGELSETITSTGTLEAVKTVEVGTQVSAKIVNIYVDYNDVVTKGQILAVLDTTFLSANVKDAKASLAKAEAQFEEAKSKYELSDRLHKKSMISELDYISSKTEFVTANASVQSARSNLERAETNLEYAVIKSPINGTIINRDVEEGQTVAASLQAPTLFTIAANLSEMEILAMVDESDIGEIKKGQKATFTVPAYWDKEFSGTVKQIRLQPTVESNVVNYTVVVYANNQEGLLLPGMTATLDFYINHTDNALLVPASAINYTPSEELLTEYRERMQQKFANRPDSSNGGSRGFGRRNPPDMGSSNVGKTDFKALRNKIKTVWYLDDEGKLMNARFIAGFDNGKFYQVERSRMLKEGMQVIIGTSTTSDNAKSSRKQNQMMPPRGPGMGRPF